MGVTRTILLIMGMRDASCTERVGQALDGIPGVQDVDVSLFRFRASVIHEVSCSVATLIKAVETVGYQATPV